HVTERVRIAPTDSLPATAPQISGIDQGCAVGVQLRQEAVRAGESVRLIAARAGGQSSLDGPAGCGEVRRVCNSVYVYVPKVVNRNLLAADFEVAAAQIGGVHQSVASR